MTEELKARIAQINAGTAPAGYKKTKVGIVPEEWETIRLGNICEINRGGSPRPIEQYLTTDSNGTNWIKIGDAEVGGKYITSTKEKIKPTGEKKSRRVYSGDFLLSNSMSYGRPYILQIDGCIHDGWLVISKYQHCFILDYLYYTLCSTQVQKQYDILSAGSGVQNLNKELVSQVTVMIPPLPEQQKIAEILTAQDVVIALMQKQIELLQKQKKAFLQKMFPQKGCTVPEIRFAGFTDAWEQRKFGELVVIERGGSPRPIDDFITDSPDGLNWVKIGDAPEQGNYITSTKEKIKPEGLTKTREVHPGDLILSNSMSFGKPYIMAIDGCIHDGWLSIKNTNNVFDLKFLCVLLGTDQMLTQYKSMAAGSTVNNLNKELVGNTTVTYPNIEEQRTIGQFFEKIESLITLHQRKIEIEQQKKKALMQLLLTGKVRCVTTAS